MEEKRSLLNPFEMLVLLLAIGVIAYVIYHNDGIDLIKKTEQVEIIENPKRSSQFQARSKTPNQQEQEIDRALTSLAQQFSGSTGSNNKKTAQNKLEHLGLSKDEVAFYKKINDTYKFDDKIKNTQDWFTVLKTANSTYSKVKSLLQNSNQTVENATADASSSDLTEKGIPQSLSFQMKKVFKLSEEDLQDFARKGEKDISDWATFIMKNQQ